MSVALFQEKDLVRLTNTLTENEKVLKFVESTEIYQKRVKYSYEDSRQTLARALWYGYVANRTAFNLQYSENEPINFNIPESDETYKFKTAMSNLGFLLYNIATNDGNVFLSDEWSNLLEGIYKKFKSYKYVDVPTYVY